tara:strand:- start:149 stop:454 length:306 start_codon:yes stop_codon:yes gene_type:complete
MNTIDEPKKRGRPKKRKVGRPKGSFKIITDDEKRIRKNKNNRLQREYYKRNITLNPTKIRAYTKEEKERKKIIKQRQALLQTEQTINKTESEKEIQGEDEK